MYPNRSFPNSGIFVQEQVKALRKKIDGDITVICPVPWVPRFLWFRDKWRRYGQVERQRADGRVNCYFPRFFCLPGRPFSPLQVFFVYLSIRKLVKRLIAGLSGGTVLHAHMLLPDGLAATLLKKKFKLPVVCTAHGSDVNIYPFANPLNMRLTRRALKDADAVAAVSNKLKDGIEKLTKAAKDISVIYNGADLAKFKPISKERAKEMLGVSGEGRGILFVGNLIKLKCIDVLIKAFFRLKRKMPDGRLKLFLIGEGPEKKGLLSLARLLKLEEHVIFLGAKPHDEIPLWLNMADTFVLPSASEGFPTIIVEALACGIPIISTNVGGVQEAVIEGKTALLVKPHDVDGLAEAMGRVLKEADLADSMRKNQKDFPGAFTWAGNAQAYWDIYRRYCKD